MSQDKSPLFIKSRPIFIKPHSTFFHVNISNKSQQVSSSFERSYNGQSGITVSRQRRLLLPSGTKHTLLEVRRKTFPTPTDCCIFVPRYPLLLFKQPTQSISVSQLPFCADQTCSCLYKVPFFLCVPYTHGRYSLTYVRTLISPVFQ